MNDKTIGSMVAALSIAACMVEEPEPAFGDELTTAGTAYDEDAGTDSVALGEETQGVEHDGESVLIDAVARQPDPREIPLNIADCPSGAWPYARCDSRWTGWIGCKRWENGVAREYTWDRQACWACEAWPHSGSLTGCF